MFSRAKPDVKDLVCDLTQNLKVVFAGQLKSVILYGSIVTQEYIHRRSDLNILVVLEKIDLDKLPALNKFISRWKRYRVGIPLFLSEDEIKARCDVFAIEFLEMKENYKVIYGEDILKDLNIDKLNLRHQCEFELNSKLINLRQIFLSIESLNKKEIEAILIKSFNSLKVIFKSLVRLKPDLDFSLSKEPFLKLAKLKERNNLSRKELVGLYKQLIIDLGKLISVVDKLFI